MVAPVDGFTLLRFVRESHTELRAVGISYVLPSSQLPIDARLKLFCGQVRYRVRVGSDCDRWQALTASKRWKAVYAYAENSVDPAWNWEVPVVGTIDVFPRD